MYKEKRIDCFKCNYFYITWDKNNPRGCKYFGFKTRLMPSMAVFRSSGRKCRAFAEKNK
ncbi:uracil-DNA glycosylase [Paramaledivibacter caminithermalis]|jgi:hypothetical protein|uniref:Uracil-DNA glycosylase n=1 Tax=Paramaledivibacter caminithermalis (strain DSM 15212 / CIP 107654 / DViRD3) TaxID=1121301 RepID=A0A1M6PU08_PARC5|nr:uracil-DNA glycosylase [Paramaledivibacter caminithermalis]SHK11443.1 hypothetical protein SAMN02745912_02285 [Paramaledivibacter caminithermalis DSM 15212]